MIHARARMCHCGASARRMLARGAASSMLSTTLMHQMTILNALHRTKAATVVRACYRGIRDNARGVHRHRQRRPFRRAMRRARRSNPSVRPAADPAPGPPRGRLAPPRKGRGRKGSDQGRVRNKRVLRQSKSLDLDSGRNLRCVGTQDCQAPCLEDMQKPAEMTTPWSARARRSTGRELRACIGAARGAPVGTAMAGSMQARKRTATFSTFSVINF